MPAITELNRILEIISHTTFEKNSQRYRSTHIYRGLPDDHYELKTSLQRICKEKQNVLEKMILRNFSKYAVLDVPEIEKSVWRQLILGQHHGLPTRLLDWTLSPLIGLHFATAESNLDNMEQHDCALWEIDIEEINNLLPAKYKNKLDKESAYLFTTTLLDNIAESMDIYDQDMAANAFALLEPPSIDQRIINQYSYFAVVPSGIKDIESFLNEHTQKTHKYIIDKKLRWQIRDLLDQMNINERIVFPGLDGLAQWLARYYFVKSTKNNS